MSTSRRVHFSLPRALARGRMIPIFRWALAQFICLIHELKLAATMLFGPHSFPLSIIKKARVHPGFFKCMIKSFKRVRDRDDQTFDPQLIVNLPLVQAGFHIAALLDDIPPIPQIDPHA